MDRGRVIGSVGIAVLVIAVGTVAMFKVISKNSCSLSTRPLHLVGCNLSGVSLHGVNLSGADLSRANLSHEDLSSSNLDRVESGGITGVPSKLPAEWELVNGYLVGPGANLSNAHLARANLGDTASGGGSPAFLTGANLEGANLAGTNLRNAGLRNTNLNHASLAGAKLYRVISGGIVGTPKSLPTSWSLVNGFLIGPGAALLYSDLSGANLVGAFMMDDQLVGTDLNGADLGGADLFGSAMDGVNLTGADLVGAVLGNILWTNTTCPDGTNSDFDGHTCIYDL